MVIKHAKTEEVKQSQQSSAAHEFDIASAYPTTEEVKQSEHSCAVHEYDIASAYPTLARTIEQIKAQPKRRTTNDVTMLGIERELHRRLRQVAAFYTVPMGRIAEIAVTKLLDDIESVKSKG